MRASDSSSPVLILPGRGNSDPQHWQSLWETANPGFHRVIQDEWERVDCTAWQQRLESAVAAAGPGTVLAAHRLVLLLAVHCG
ncbi:MAG: RBBP9/YdeN family alpha/beta hydrolase, partial [Steroidobacteraceae bacterium]